MFMLRRSQIAVVGVLAAAASVLGQSKTEVTSPSVYTGTIANMTPGAGSKISIQVLRWSSDDDREHVLSVLNSTKAKSPDAAVKEKSPDTTAKEKSPDTAAKEKSPDTVAKDAKEKSQDELVKALGSLPTVGYIWSTGPVGYALKYAFRVAGPSGGERVVVMTDRLLGSWEHPAWTTAGHHGVSDNPFTVVELHLNSKGLGDGKMSLTAPITIDEAAKTLGLGNYDAASTLLTDVRRQSAPY
jgi:hypothetical protein